MRFKESQWVQLTELEGLWGRGGVGWLTQGGSVNPVLVFVASRSNSRAEKVLCLPLVHPDSHRQGPGRQECPLFREFFLQQIFIELIFCLLTAILLASNIY